MEIQALKTRDYQFTNRTLSREVFLIPIPAVMSPVSMPPIGSSIIGISVGTPIVSRSIIPGTVVVARMVSRAVIGGA
jgi:hypothetical protein